jgi:hypothetical protein
MKPLSLVTRVFTCVIMVSIAITLPADDEAQFTLPDDVGTGKVLGIHYYTLRQGVAPSAFEKFIVNEWEPVISERFPGIKMMIMKGERGSKIGQYVMVYDITSLYVRDFYWPSAGGSTDAANAIIESCGDQCSQLWTRFGEMAERTDWTDYVGLTKK